jgi:hypothetical protein
MPATYEPIATTTLGSAAASIAFTSITSAYTDLRLVVTSLASASTIGGMIQFNSDTGSNYSYTRLTGNGTAASTTRVSNFTQLNTAFSGNATTTIPMLQTVDVFSYAGSTNKTILVTSQSDQNGSGNVERSVGLWRNTAAITRIDVFPNSANNFATGTTATLYGIKAA